MSTRALIAIEEDRERFTGVYLHSDGYPEHTGKMLLENYQTETLVRGLLALGDLSSLGAEVGEQQPFYGRPDRVEGVRNWCLAYHRDRGDNWGDSMPLHWTGRYTFEMSLLTVHWYFEWAYLFRDGAWLVVNLRYDSRDEVPLEGLTWRPLKEVVEPFRNNGLL